MSPAPQKTEKRKFVRYQVQSTNFAALGKASSRVGRVRDVSMGGLAFEYISDQQKDNDLFRIDIFATGNGFHLSRIPCRKIYEIPDSDADKISSLSSELRTKRCGVEFADLIKDQVDQVTHLIETFTTHRVQSSRVHRPRSKNDWP